LLEVFNGVITDTGSFDKIIGQQFFKGPPGIVAATGGRPVYEL
jgi:hypothetical protein